MSTAKKKLLKCETNTPAMGELILDVFEHSKHLHANAIVEADFEHGQWWVTCLDCGEVHSVHDAVGGDAIDGFGFELTSAGDGDCS